jgi:hypothetical protein
MPAAEVFQQIGASQDGPFSQYLRPRPIDTLPPPGQSSSGFESDPAAIGEVALGFLQGVRKNRVAQFLEQDQNAETSLNNFRQYVNSKLSDPDLTEEGRQAIQDEANTILNTHMQYEMRDVPKGGVQGFLKNILTNLSGGPIKTREPINWDMARGRISSLAGGQSQKANYQTALNEAMAKLSELKGPDGNRLVMPSEVQSAMAPIFSKVAMSAPAYAQIFQQAIGSMVPKDPFAEAMTAKKIEFLQNGFGGRPTQQPPAAPPSMAPPADAPPSGEMRIGPGEGASIPIPQMVRRADAAAAPSGPATTTPPSLNLHDPMTKILLKEFGMEIGKPGTLYDPSDVSKYEANVIRHPLTGEWVNYTTGQAVSPEKQSWVPDDQLKLPSVSGEVLASGASEPGGTPQLVVVNRGGATSRPVMLDGKPVYGQPLLEEIPGAGGRPIYGTRGQALGQPIPPPQMWPQTERDMQLKRSAEAMLGQMPPELVNDRAKQREWVMQQPVNDAEVRTKALEIIGNPPAARQNPMDMLGAAGLLGGGTSVAPAGQPRTPKRVTDPPPAAPPAAGAAPNARRIPKRIQ